MVAVAVAVAACRGPDPSGSVVAVAPSPVPGHERVEVALVNRGRHGEVTVVVRLADDRGGARSEQRTVDMGGDERLSLAVDIAAPPGTYTATVDVQYPD